MILKFRNGSTIKLRNGGALQNADVYRGISVEAEPGARAVRITGCRFGLRSRGMSTLAIVLIVVLLVLLFAGFPGLGFHGYGWGPSGLLLVVLAVVLVLLLTGRL